MYEEYCANYKRAQDKLLFLMKQPAFSDFVEVLLQDYFLLLLFLLAQIIELLTLLLFSSIFFNALIPSSSPPLLHY